MFPKGVVYEGVDEKPRFYRGETGANDNIIPNLDNLF
jgi:indoleamine 2,3-dioxygenase